MATPQQQVEQFQVTINPGVPPDRKDESLESRLLTEVRKNYDLTRTSRSRRYYLWLISSLFAKAIHYTHYNQWTGVVQEWSQERIAKCMYTPVPLIYYAVENLAAQYINSNPSIEPMPLTDDDPKIKAVTRSLKSYAEWLDYEFYRKKPIERQTEVKLIPLRGVYSFLEWDRTGGAKIKLPQYAPQQATMCADCGAEVQDGGMGGGRPTASGSPDVAVVRPQSPQGGMGGGIQGGMGACPECGSTNVQTQVTGIANQGSVEGRQGCVKRHVVDPFQVEIYDRTKGIEPSPYLIYDEVCFKTKILKDYKWLKAVTGNVSLGNSQEGFLGLHYLMQLETVISNTGRLDQSQPEYMSGLGGAVVAAGYQGSFLHDKLCWRRRAWLDPDEYASDEWKTDEKKWVQLPGSGKPIPPGTFLRDIFPQGMLIHIINGNQVVKVDNQAKNSVWNYVACRPPAEGLHGPGVNPLVSLNRGYDEANSFEMQALLMCALGIIIADERVQNVRNIPGSIATIPLSARLPNESIQSLVGRLDMGGGQAISAAEPIKEGFRGAIGDLSMSANPQGYGNRPTGVGKETATAARYNAGATSTLTGPPLELYAASKAQVITQAVALERTYNLRPRQFGKFGGTVVEWLDPVDIPEECPFAPSEESWRPRTLETQREDVGAFAQVMGMLGPEGDAATIDKAKQVFGMDAEVSDYEDWAVIGEKRLDALKRALPAVLQEMEMADQQAAQIAAMQQGAMMPPDEAEGQDNAGEEGMEPPASPGQRLIQVAGVAPRPLDMPGHVFSARFWAERFTTDEFDSWHPVLQDAVEQMFILHSDGIGQAGAVATDQMVTAQGPAMQAQSQQAAQQAQQEQAGSGTEHAQNLQGLAAEDAKSANEHKREMEAKKHDAREADKARGHERRQAAMEHKHTVTETKEKTRGAIAVAKSKPKPKPGNSKRR